MAGNNAFGGMSMGYKIGSQTGKDYSSDVASVAMNSLSKAAGVIARKQAVMQKKLIQHLKKRKILLEH